MVKKKNVRKNLLKEDKKKDGGAVLSKVESKASASVLEESKLENKEDKLSKKELNVVLSEGSKEESKGEENEELSEDAKLKEDDSGKENSDCCVALIDINKTYRKGSKVPKSVVALWKSVDLDTLPLVGE